MISRYEELTEVEPARSKEKRRRIAQLSRLLRDSERELRELAGGDLSSISGLEDWRFDDRTEGIETAILDALPAQIAVLDPDGIILTVNRAWHRFAEGHRSSGASPAVSSGSLGVGQSYLEVCDRAEGEEADDARRAAEGIRKVLRGSAQKFSLEYPCHAPSEQRWFELIATPLAPGPRFGAVITHIDITQRRLAEDAMRESAATLNAAQRIAHFGSWELDLRGGEGFGSLRWSDEMFRIAGLTPGSTEVTRDFFFSLVPPEEHRAIRAAVDQAIRDRRSYSIVHRMVRPGGEERIIQEMAEVVVDEGSGRPRKMIGTAHDITELKRAEETLRASEARLAAAQARARLGSWEIDPRTQRVICSAEMFRILGREPSAEPLPLAALMDMVHPEDHPRANEIAHGRGGDQELRLMRPDGTIRWVHGSSEIVRDETGRTVRIIGTSQDITERKEAARERDRLFNLSLDLLCVASFEGRFQQVNPAWTATLGWTAEELTSRPSIDFVWPEDREATLRGREMVLRGIPQRGFENRYLCKDGSYRWLSWAVYPLEESRQVFAVARDVTEVRRNEQRSQILSRLGRSLNSALNPRRAAEIITGIARELFDWDAASLDLYDPVTGLITAILTIDTIDGVRQDFAPAYDQAPPSPLAWRALEEGGQLILRDPRAAEEPEGGMFGDRSRRSLSLMFVPIHDGERTVGVLSIQSYRPKAYAEADLGMLKLLADYCGGALNRIRTEELRRVSESKFRRLAESNVLGVVSWHADGRITEANDAFLNLLGFTRADLAERLIDWRALTPPEYRHLDEQALAELSVRGSCAPFEKVFLRKDGQPTPVLIGAATLEGHSDRGICFVLDLAERKFAEERLAEQAALLDSAAEAILVKDLETRIIYWNKGAERTYGWTAAEVLGRKSVDLLYQDPAAVQQALTRLVARGEWQGEFHARGREGRELQIEARWTLVRDAQGRPKSVLSIGSDVTDKKRIETHFLRAQRLESIGTLAGGIAHDLNNVLAPILMSIEVLKAEEKDPERLNLLASIESSAQRGADMVRQVLSFARGVEGRRVAVNITHVIREVQKIVLETFPRNIRLEVHSDPRPWLVQADPTQLHQVLMNLVVNARDAMPGGGYLRIGVRNSVLDEIYSGMNPEAELGPYLVISVEDTGSGISPEIQARIFDPFFTTKEPGKGTGLGLSTVLTIVKSHRGFIHLYSESAKGSAFKVYLPATATPAESERVVAEQTKFPLGQGETVLVVDDEENIRATTRKTLERFGYRVLVAANGAEAAGLFAQHRAEVAVVLTDMAMPVMDGAATIVALKSIDPGVKVIASSGMLSDGGVVQALGAGVSQFVPKPYTAETLLRTLHQVLHGDAPA